MKVEVFQKFMANVEEIYKKKGGDRTEFTTVEKDAEGNPTVFYFKFAMPFFMTDRDGLLQTSFKKIGDQVIYLTNSIERDDYPLRKDRIRMSIFGFSIIE